MRPSDDAPDWLDDLDRAPLDPADDVGPAALDPARAAGFVGRRSRSVMTDGEESRVTAIVDHAQFEFGEAQAELVAGADDFDEAMRIALSLQGAVVVGDPLGAEPFSVWRWPEVADVVPPPALQLIASPDVGAIVMGCTALCPANPVERTLRWVTVPGLAEFYGLSDDLQAWVRAPMEAAWRSAEGMPSLKRAVDDIGFPALRVLLASHPSAVSVRKVVRKGEDRGGVVYGITRPYLTQDLGEPEIYLPVISMKEGNVDAINAWDLDAGVSLGPVQYNVISGHLFATLRRVQLEDPDLFAATFAGLGWRTAEVDGRPALVVSGADGEVTLVSARGETRDDIRRNAGYFQSGALDAPSGRIDGDFRRDLTARFRNLVLWPHVQRWIMAESGAYLARGARMMDAEKVPAVDPAALEADAYTLRALLMSGFVRYSASLRYTLQKFAGLGSADAATLLRRLPAALDGVAARDAAWADRVANLRVRYFGAGGKPGQRDHAATVLSMRG